MSAGLDLGIQVFVTDRFTGPSQKVAKGMKRMRDEANDTVTKFSKLESTLTAVAGSALFQGASRSLEAVSKPFVEFQEKMFQVHTLIDDGSFNIENYSNQILEMSKKWGSSNIDQAAAAYELLSTPIANSSNSLELLDVANKMAVGGMASTTEAVDLLSTVMLSWKMDTEQAMDAADSLFTTVKLGKTNIPELAGFISQAAPVASVLGVSLDELGVAIGNMTAQGTPTRVAMTQVKVALASMVEPSEELTEIWNALGFDSATTAIKTIGLQKALTAIQVAANGDVGAMQELLGSFDAVQAVLKNTGENAASYNFQLEAMKKKAGATESAVSKMQESQAHKNRQLAASWEQVKITIGSALYDVFQPIIKAVSFLTDKVGKFMTKFPVLSKIIASSLGVFASFAIVIGVVATVVGVLDLVLSPLILTILAVAAVIAAVIGLFIGIAEAVDYFTGENDYLINRMIEGWNWVKALVQDLATIFVHDFWPKIKMVASALGEALIFPFKLAKTVFIGFIELVMEGFDKLFSLLEKLPQVGEQFTKLREDARTFVEAFKQADISGALGEAAAVPFQAGADFVDDRLGLIRGRASQIRQQESFFKPPSQENQASMLTQGKVDRMGNVTTNPDLVVQMPNMSINTADVMLDSKKVGEIVFSMAEAQSTMERVTP